MLLVALVTGCAGPRERGYQGGNGTLKGGHPTICTAPQRPFDFRTDTFSYSNALVWVYHYDAKGKWVSEKRVPKPDYTLHCFVVARCTKQFFDFAKFDPQQPVADAATYRRLIHRVVTMNPRRPVDDARRVVIPGYANLRAFSEAWEALLKAACGSAWESYIQRGHWRMIFPFTRHHQERTAEQLLARVQGNQPLVVHVLRFPSLAINHALVVFDAQADAKEIRFTIYDPNTPDKPGLLTYYRDRHTFYLPANSYFSGGLINVYEIFHRWDY
jgi:hypothetical protein